MSFSLRWLHLTNVTTAASVELLLIYIGLPSETHPVKCLGCIQATSGKVSLAGGKLKRDCSFPQHRAQLSLPLRAEKPQGALNFCTGSPLPTQRSGSQSMAAVEVEWMCFHSSAFPHLGYRGGMLEVLNNGRRLLCVQTRKRSLLFFFQWPCWCYSQFHITICYVCLFMKDKRKDKRVGRPASIL